MPSVVVKRAPRPRSPPGRRKAVTRRAYRVAVQGEQVPLARRAVDEISRQLLRAYRLVEVTPESVLAEAASRGLPAASIQALRRVPQAKRDALATTFIKTAKIWAAGHGTSLGAAGIVTMAADIAALVAVNLRMIQHVALAYGVKPSHEKLDAWALLLNALGEPLDPKSAREIPAKQAPTAASRLVAETARLFTRRLLRSESAGRAVPVVGAVFGGLSNYAFTARVGTRAREFYQSLAP